jgi:hypothetical protein
MIKEGSVRKSKQKVPSENSHEENNSPRALKREDNFL